MGAGSREAIEATGGVVTTTVSGKHIQKNHTCEMCSNAFCDINHLNQYKLLHSNEKLYQCLVCQKHFTHEDRMSYHVHSYDNAMHNCSHYGKNFSWPDHLNSHVRQVLSTERPFRWEKCEADFAAKD